MSNWTKVSPEDQIDNVLKALENLASPHLVYRNGRMDAIRSSIGQLRDLWTRYKAGELEPIIDDPEIPF